VTKKFHEVFPGLKLNSDLEAMFEDTEITKVGANRDKSHIRIYLLATHLIPCQDVDALEAALQNLLFPNGGGKVTVIEKFDLSSQYTAESLFEHYFESMLWELKKFSTLEYNQLRMADLNFTDEKTLVLTMDDNIVGRDKGSEIVSFLEKIVCERCGMDLIIRTEFREPKESKYRKNMDLQIQKEVDLIIERSASLSGMEDGEGVAVSAEGAEAKATSGDSKTENVSGAKQDAKAEKKTAQSPVYQNKNAFEKKGEFRRRFERGFTPKFENPDMIFGRDFEDEFTEIIQIDAPIGEVSVNGCVMSLETREIKNERILAIGTITDFTDTIGFKLFLKKEEEAPEVIGAIGPGSFIKIRGVANLDRFDNDLAIGQIIGIKKSRDNRVAREDTAPEKRVELHCHTKMSDMDGVSDVKDIIKQAKRWGHKAIAITDHGDLQAFPDANHAISHDDDFKIIYGVEGYLVDDLKEIVTDSKGQSLQDTYVVFDLETTGFIPGKNKIIEIGAVKVQDGKIVDRFSKFVNPQVPIPFRIEKLTSIRDDMVSGEPTIDVILPEFMEFCKDAVMVGHNVDFDISFIYNNCAALGIAYRATVLDTVALSRVLLPQLAGYKLNQVAKALGVSLENHHRAVDDAEATAGIFLALVEKLESRGIHDLDAVNEELQNSEQNILKMHPHHAIILATCDQGRTNLYRLVSDSHIKYYQRQPRIAKSEFLKYRDGLLIGSAIKLFPGFGGIKSPLQGIACVLCLVIGAAMAYFSGKLAPAQDK